MAPEEIAKLVSDNPVLLTILAVLLIAGYALKIISQASETAAKLLGPLGKRWRAQGDRVARKSEARRVEDNQVITDLNKRLEYFVKQVEGLVRDSEEKARAYEVKDDYLAYDAQWHADQSIHAAENGYEFQPPKHMTFNEFRRQASGWSDPL